MFREYSNLIIDLNNKEAKVSSNIQQSKNALKILQDLQKFGFVQNVNLSMAKQMTLNIQRIGLRAIGCSKRFHMSCGENYGVFDDDETFHCRGCLY